MTRVSARAILLAMVVGFVAFATAALAITGVSTYSIIPPSPQTIQSVVLNSPTFIGGSPNANAGTVSVTMSPASPPFGGSLSLTGTNSGGFHLSGNNLLASPSGTAAGPYADINITATQAGISNSPQSLAPSQTAVIGYPAQTIQSISLTNSTFNSGNGNAVVGIVSVLMNPATPAFSGTLSITGTNSGGFHLVNGTTLATSAAGTAVGTYNDFTIVATQNWKQVTNSPQSASPSVIGSAKVQSIKLVSLGNSTYTSNSANAAVGTISVTMDPATPAFSGTLAVSGTNSGGFHLNGTTLQAAAGGTGQGPYDDFLVTASQSGMTSVPVAPVVIGSATTQTIASIAAPNPGGWTSTSCAFKQGTAGSCNLTVTMNPSSPLYSGTLSLINANSYCRVDSNTVDTTHFGVSQSPYSITYNGSAALGEYSLCVQVSQSGLPTYYQAVVAAVTSGGTMSVNTNPITSPATLAVTYSGGPGDGTDLMHLVNPWSGEDFQDITIPLGSTSGTINIAYPDTLSDRKQYWQLRWDHPVWVPVATPIVIVVNPTLSPSAPTAGLPVSAGGAPFTVQHVLDVCPSGCTYTWPSDATTVAANNSWDYIEITVKGGDYGSTYLGILGGSPGIVCPPLGCTYDPYGPPYPPFTQFCLPAHTWIHGWSPDGVTFPKFWGGANGGAAFGAANACFGQKGQAILTVDNIEVGPWADKPSIGIGDATLFTLRNIYSHDCGGGIESSNDLGAPDLYWWNVHAARCGQSAGPQHDVYLGEGNGAATVTVKNSVFEQPRVGHAFKDRFSSSVFQCDILEVNTDNFYQGSETIDMSEGGYMNVDHILSVSGGDGYQFDNIRYAHEKQQQWFTPPNGPYNMTPTVTNSIFLGDGDAQRSFFMWFVALTNPPITTWTGNEFVVPRPADWGTGGASNGYGTIGTCGNCGFPLPPYPAGNAGTGPTAGVITDITFNASTNIENTTGTTTGDTRPRPLTYPQSYYDILPLYNTRLGSFCTDPVGSVLLPTTPN